MNNSALAQDSDTKSYPSSNELSSILKLQSQVLEKVVQDASPSEIFNDICQFIEFSVPNCVASIMLLNASSNQLEIACAPSIPIEAHALLNGLVPSEEAGSCGSSVFLGMPVYVTDTRTNPRWTQLQAVVEQLGVQACWSYPIHSDAHEISGSIAISSFKPRSPDPFHANLLEAASNIIGIVLKRATSQKHLANTESLLQNITNAVPGVLYQYRLLESQKQEFTYISPGIKQITGILAEDAYADFGLVWKQVHPEDQAALWASIIHTSRHELAWSHEFRIYHRNGELRWIRGSSLPQEKEPDGTQLWNGVLLDVTPEKASIEQLRLAGIAFSSTNEGIMIADRHNRIIDINRSYANICGYSREEVIGQSPSLFRSDKHSPEFYQSIWTALEQNKHWQGEIWNRRKNGDVVPHLVNISAVFDPITQELTHYVSVVADISSIKASEAKLSHLAHHDALTNLPNRLLFSARLDHALTHRKKNEKIAMLHLDLDRFKHINDTLGHTYGDQLLLQVTERLTNTLEKHDTVARIGGDEFAILVADLDHAADASAIADKIVNAMEHPFTLDGNDYFTTASIGIALAPEHGDDIDTLSKNADIAVYQAKDLGRNNYAFFLPELSESVEEWIRLEPLLRKALAEQQFVLYYQPQMDSAGKKIIGAEALIRWNHPEIGIVPPDQFLSIAEEIGIMKKIGDWVLEASFSQLSAWKKEGLKDFKLAINLASDQITQQDLPQRVAALLSKYDIPPEMIELEILETFLLEDEIESAQTFKELRELGVHLALDDFGTGYSSLRYLKQLPINKVKIDQSLVRDIPEDPDDEAIAKAVILLGHTLDLKVCAEGVETSAQRAFLEGEACDQLQGYLFSKPLHPDDFNTLLIEHQRLTQVPMVNSV